MVGAARRRLRADVMPQVSGRADGADVMPQVSGRADGSVVSQLVKEKLA
jgi:uncharacterized protein YqeY